MKRSKSLTPAFVETVNRPGLYGDDRGGHGLSLLVKNTRNGRLSKTWSQRLQFEGHPFNLGLGSYPKVSLERAREVAHGKDPRVPAAVPTFREAAEAVIERSSQSWKAGGSTKAQWIRSFEKHVYPKLGSTTVDTISAANVIEVLKPIWTDRRAIALVVRQRIRKVLDWCQAYGYATENVADARIGAVMLFVPTTKTHFRALPYKEVRGALVAVNECGASLATRLCIRFLILTVARRGAWRKVERD